MKFRFQKYLLRNEATETPEGGGGGVATPSETPANESAVDHGDPQRQDSPQPDQTQQNWVSKEEYESQFNGVKSHVDKRFGNVEQSTKQINEQLEVIQPLIKILKGENGENQDPYKNEILKNPVEQLIAARRELDELKQTTKQTSEDQQKLINDMVIQFTGQKKEALINEAHQDKYPDKTSFERAKYMAVNSHRNVFQGLMQQYEGDSVKAFGAYTKLLETGVFNDGSDEAKQVVDALSQHKVRSEKIANSGFGDSMNTGNNYQGGQKPDSLFNFTY